MSTIICRRLSFGYPSSEDNIFQDLDLVVDTGWRCALVGRNGRGKTTLLRLLHGELVPDRGSVELGQPTAYFPRPVKDPDLPVRDVVKDASGPFRRWETEMRALLEEGSDEALAQYGRILDAYEDSGGYAIDARIETELGALGIDETFWQRPFSRLSGGEQTRCLIASLFASDGSEPTAKTDRTSGNGTFPLIDEPTNHLDTDGRRIIADYLRSKPGFLLCSHDRAFLDGCCDHVVALNRDTVEVERTTLLCLAPRFPATSCPATGRERRTEAGHRTSHSSRC